jgi:hypothetical protein
MRARFSFALALSAMSLGCMGAIGGNDSTPGLTGSGSGTGAAGSGATGVGSGNAGSSGSGTAGAGTTGVGTGAAGDGSTGVGTGVAGTGSNSGAAGQVTLPGSALISQPAYRLTSLQYMNSARDLLGIPVSVALDPDDSSTGGFWIGGPASEVSVRAYHNAAITIATSAVSAANLAKVVPCSATPTAACASTFIDTLAPKAFRRPLDATQRTALNGVFTTNNGKYGFAAGIQGVIEAILQSPSFLYHLELEEQAQAAGKVAVTGYSMADRLSYLLWATTPDDTLLTKAGAGMLSTPAQVLAEANRMIADQRAKVGVRYFYEQWMHLPDLPTSKTAPFATIYTQALANSIKTSFDMQMDDALWADKGAVSALLTSRETYADATLAPILGVTGVTGTAMQKVAVPTTQRAGILTHPALMSIFATENESHPIKRGVFMWDKVLCRPLPDPPANVPPFVAPGPGVSLRQQFETLTADKMSCQPCHRSINPVGFLFEAYDTVGRFRTIDDNNQPVNTQVTMVGTGNPALDVATANAAEFADRLGANDASVASCMVNHLYRFMAKRSIASGDAAELDKLNTGFTASGQSFKQLLVSLTQSEVFLNRLNVK